jgi:L-lactate dehydrogenase complex protein LldE
MPHSETLSTARTAAPKGNTPSRPTRVAFFATCLADRFFAEACSDAVRILEHLGVTVDVPANQTCCGQPAYNAGHRAEAARMARQTAKIFAEAEHVVLPSGSCAGMIRSFYPELLADLPAGTGRPRSAVSGPVGPDLAPRTHELSSFLVHELDVLGPDWRDHTDDPPRIGTGLDGVGVVYHHGCHALRELGVRDEPVALLRACGADVVPWGGDTECCGFGGLFSTKFPEVSSGMADRKLDALPPDIDFVTSADGGCLLQLSGRARHLARAAGAPTPAGHPPAADPAPAFVHLATLLRRGLGA